MTTTRPRLVDTQAAAIAVGRRPATIRSWIHRGHLTPHGKDRAGRTLVDLAEVYRTATSTSTRNRHTRDSMQH